MMHTAAFQAFVRSDSFLGPLGLSRDTVLDFTLLGQGEYNINFLFTHPETGRRLVLRVNMGSQMHLPDQIAYEFHALRDLISSGRTPEPLFYDDSRAVLPHGTLVMEWLPGRPLCYETDLPEAAQILADIHGTPVPAHTRLIRPAFPALAIYEECLAMAERYFTWEHAEPTTCKLLTALVEETGRLPLRADTDAPRCMVNTELNSGNFLIHESGPGHLIDWEKPLLSEPAQDLGHFLAPTTTFWKTDVILTPEKIHGFVRAYESAVAGRLDLSALRERLPLFFTVTCLRGVAWCAMALREYEQPGRPLVNWDTHKKLRQYVSEDFLRMILERYVRRSFLR